MMNWTRLNQILRYLLEEEEVLTLEYVQLINRVEGCIAISEDIDRVLLCFPDSR